MSSRIYLPKASKNHIKMVQHLMRIGANMVQNQGLEGVWGAFGQLRGGLLGVSWLQGTSVPLPWRFLGSFSIVLEASWAPLGRLLGRLGHQVGASWVSWEHHAVFCSDFYALSQF